MRFILIAATMLLAVGLGTASAEERDPDLRGTWVGEAKAVYVVSPGPPTDARFSTSEIVLKINQQEDRRFSGLMTVDETTRPIVGVIAFDGKIWWSEPGGFVEGHLTDPDTFEGCYVRISAFSQLAACEILKRQE